MSLFGKLLQTAFAAAAAIVVSHGSAQAQTCGVALDKTAMTVGANEANWIVNVSTVATCAWTATSDSTWLVVKSTMPVIAAGNGYAKVRAIANTTSPGKRTGHFFVNGVVYTVTQGGCGTSCTPDPPANNPPPVTKGVPVNPGTLRVLQYNTHHGGWGTDGVYRPDRIVAQIVKVNPDVVCMNEIEQFDSWSKNADQTAVYQTLLQDATGKTWYKVFMNHAGATTGNGNLILSTFPFIATASYLLPASRSAVDATIDVSGRTVNIVSTHLDNVSAGNRKNEINALLPWAVTLAEDRVILGDYNASPGTTEIGLMKVDYVDTWTAAQAMSTAKGTGTTHGSSRIDYVFLSKKASFLKLASVETFNTSDANGVKPSDHEPVLAVFNVQ
jgi:endonuclease/exonuclease/phosphatase family metal-dependent hydrolase